MSSNPKRDEAGRDSVATGDGQSLLVPPSEANGVQLSATVRRLPKPKLYQDELYGSKELSPLAAALIDTPEFQRLGHIYQLGMTFVAFRGGNHRRFDHCVGTHLVARGLMRRIVQNHARFHSADEETFRHPGLWLSPRLYMRASGTPASHQADHSAMGRWRGATEVVAAAALLHDLGHIAIGHTLEDEFSVFRKHDGLGGPRLFALLYGPREPRTQPDSGASEVPGPLVSNFFERIDAAKLPEPDPADLRLPLPWVFEHGTYEPILPAVEDAQVDSVRPLSNGEIRDLIYLILSFKESISRDSYETFPQILAASIEKASEEDLPRLSFIQALYNRYSRREPLTTIGSHHESCPVFQPFMADLVGNTICADLLDYLARDGKRLNLAIRTNPRLQRYLVIRPERTFASQPREAGNSEMDADLRVTINAVYRNGLPRRDSVSDLVDLMLERRRFAETVYYHPKKCAFSSMYAKALELAGPTYKPRDDDAIYPAPWTSGVEQLGRPHVVHLGDEAMLEHLATGARAAGDSHVASLVRGINYRNEYRLLFTVDYFMAAKSGGGPLKFVQDLRGGEKRDDSQRRKWEDAFDAAVRRSSASHLLPGREPAVLIYCPRLQMQVKEVAARVELSPGHVEPLNRQEEDGVLAEEIRVLNEKYSHLWRLYLFCHPRLMTRLDEDSSKVLLLSALVDAFSGHYGLDQALVGRGCRFRYLTRAQRTDSAVQEWTPQILGLPADRELRDLVADIDLWRELNGGSMVPFGVTPGEWNAGLRLAACVMAAGRAESRQRDGWGADVQDFGARDWLRSSDTGAIEHARRDGLERLRKVADTLDDGVGLVGRRAKARSWTDVVSAVCRALRTRQ